MLFEREVLTKELLSQVMWPLLERHYKEVSAYQDIPLAPDFEKYEQLEKLGNVRCFTAKMTTADNTLALVGYCIFFVHINIHYTSSLQAVQDILYLEKSQRGQGLGKKFIDWCDEQLSKEGVELSYHHVKTKLNFGPLLESLGYRHVENIYARDLRSK